MVGAMTYEPEDVAVGGSDDELAAFFKECGLTIGEEVAHKLMTFHSKGAKCVARLR